MANERGCLRRRPGGRDISRYVAYLQLYPVSQTRVVETCVLPLISPVAPDTDDFRAAGVSTVRPSLAFPDARVILEVAFASALHIRGLGRATLAIPLMSRR